MRSAAILSLIFLAVALTSARAAPATIEGSWRGSGIVTYRNGADNLRCRVRYTRLTAKSFAVSSQCATESGRYELTGRVVNVGGNRYTGLGAARKPKRQSFARPAWQSSVGHGNQPAGIGAVDLGKAWLSNSAQTGPSRLLRENWIERRLGNRHRPSDVEQTEPLLRPPVSVSKNFSRYGVYAVTIGVLLVMIR